MAGELMIAPHTKMHPFPGWMRHEVKTVREIEALSRQLERQEVQKLRSMKVDEHLRSQRKRDDMRASARIRIAQHFSEADVEMNRQILKSLERKDDALIRVLTDDSSLLTGSLEIEKHEQPIGLAQYMQKSTELVTA